MLLQLREMDASEMVNPSVRVYLPYRPFTKFVVTVFVTFIPIRCRKRVLASGVCNTLETHNFWRKRSISIHWTDGQAPREGAPPGESSLQGNT